MCDRCPLASDCKAFVGGAPETYPRKTRKAERPRRYGAAYLLTRGCKVALVRRPPNGLLGGMLGLPTSAWVGKPLSAGEALAAAPAPGDWREAGEVDHVFTHFSLTLQVWRCDGAEMEDAIWTPRSGLGALPSVFLKAARAGLERLI